MCGSYNARDVSNAADEAKGPGAFGLAWDDYEELLHKFGFAPRVQVVAVCAELFLGLAVGLSWNHDNVAPGGSYQRILLWILPGSLPIHFHDFSVPASEFDV